MSGPTGAEKPMDEETKALAEQVKQKAEEKLDRKFEIFEALSFKTQVVAQVGTNYFVKVKVDAEGQCIHLRIWKPLGDGGEVKLIAVKDGFKQSDPLDDFKP